MPEHAGDLISALLDGELDAEESSRVEAHLDACPACAFERDEVQAGRAMVRGLPVADLRGARLEPVPCLHPGDAISAWIDGELDEREAADVAVHVAACSGCSAERGEVKAARRLVRALPALDPPPGTLGVPSRQAEARWRPALLGTVAAAIGVLGLVVVSEPVVADQPAMATLVSSHGRAAEPGGSPSALGSVARVPTSLAPTYRLASVHHKGNVVQATYQGGTHNLSLFARLRDTHLAGAPGPGAPVLVGEAAGRSWSMSGAQVVVWSTGGAAYAVVTDGSDADALVAARSVPPAGSTGVAATARRRCRGIVELTG